MNIVCVWCSENMVCVCVLPHHVMLGGPEPLTGQRNVRLTGFIPASLSNTNWSCGSVVDEKEGGSPVVWSCLVLIF